MQFEIDQWVWLRLQHRSATTITLKAHRNLTPRFYEPYKVLAHIGTVAYKLELLARAMIHDIFHVSLLNPFHGSPPDSTPPLPELHHGHLMPTPKKIVRSHLDRGVWELLV